MSDSSESDLIVIQPDWIKQLILASEREVGGKGQLTQLPETADYEYLKKRSITIPALMYDKTIFVATETIGLKLVKEEVRCVVWNMAINLQCRTNGVPGRACRLLERYFYFLFRSYEIIPRGAVRTAILESVMSRLMLIIACCVQLSAKMNSADVCLSPKVLRMALGCKGVSCTVSQIVKTEAEVYAVLGFRIPLWTSVEIGEQLANEIGITSDMMKEVACFVDMAEYLRNNVERKMQWAATGSSATPDGVSTLHLSAGAVLVVARFEPCTTQHTTTTTSATDSAFATMVARLANLVNAPVPYLTCLADIIFAAIRHKHDHQNKTTPLILKRKINVT